MTLTSTAAAMQALTPALGAPDDAVDLARLMQPIAGPSPAGASLRYEADYDRIREARRDEDPNLPQGVWRRDVKRADWNLVIDLCSEALSKRSKDLQIAAWLAEALVYRDGLAGIAGGLGVVTALCEQFWPTLFPEIEDGDAGARLAPLEWLNEKVAQAVYTLPLTRSGTTEPVSYSWTDYVNAQRREVAHNDDLEQASRAAILASAEATPTSFYEDVREQLHLALASTQSLNESLARCCAGEEPGFGKLRGALDHISGFVETVLAQRGDTRKVLPPIALPPPLTDDAASLTEVVDAAVKELSSPPSIKISSREEAYRLLMEIADYLFAVEPHSPTPYIVQRAASWGMMPLHKLLIELTKGSNDLAVLFELLGIDGETVARGR